MARPIQIAPGDAIRFWAKVRKSDSCWEWTAYRQSSGHGLFGLGGRAGGMVLAHRVAWTMAHGPVPDGMNVCHTCDNGACVRPDHLFLGTQADNLADMRRKGRQGDLRGEEHPKHRLTEEQAQFVLSSAEPGRVLARRFGVSDTAIRYIRSGRNWAHLSRAA